MSQSLGSAGVGIMGKGGEFEGSGQEFRIGDKAISGGFASQYLGLFVPGTKLVVAEAAIQGHDFSETNGGPAVVVMMLGDIQVAIDRGATIFD